MITLQGEPSNGFHEPRCAAGQRSGAPTRLASPVSWYFALAMTLGTAAYLPIVENYFHTEDFANLHMIVDRPFAEWAYKASAGHVQVVWNVIFAGMYRIAGGNPAPYFWSVLSMHAVNTALLFAIIFRLTGSAVLACAGATAWALAPVNEGTLGWYSYGSHALVTTVLLAVLLRMLQRWRDGAAVALREVALWAVLMLIAALTVGFGLGPALAFPLVVAVLFDRSRLRRSAWAVLLAVPVAFVLFYAAVDYGTAAHIISSPVDMAKMLFHLTAFGSAALVSGFGYLLFSYPSAVAYGIALVTAAVVGIGFVVGSPSARRVMLAVGLFALAIYGTIALGRATLYRHIPRIRIYGATLTRYHYASTALLTIILCIALAQIGNRLHLRPQWSRRLLFAWLGCVGLLYWRSGWTIDHFADERRDAEAATEGIRIAVERTPPNQPVCVINEDIRSAGAFPFFAGWADIYVIYLRGSLGRPVYFLDQNDWRWRRLLGDGALTRTLYPLPDVRRRDACPAVEPLATVAE